MKKESFKFKSIPTLDKYLPEKSFINKCDIKNYNIRIDTRTITEYNNTENKLPCNIPIINESQHKFLHRHKSIAGIVVLYGLILNASKIRKELLKLKPYEPIIFACSKGRLRSPFMYVYARLLNIDARIVKGGIAESNENNRITY